MRATISRWPAPGTMDWICRGSWLNRSVLQTYSRGETVRDILGKQRRPIFPCRQGAAVAAKPFWSAAIMSDASVRVNGGEARQSLIRFWMAISAVWLAFWLLIAGIFLLNVEIPYIF